MLARRSALLCLLLLAAPLFAVDNPTKVFSANEKPADRRLGKPIDLNGYFPFTPPASKEAWERRRIELRQQLHVAMGVWPMPERGAIQSVIHGAVERDGYTVEKVYFVSLPGHYVTGNLYRPKSANAEKRPVVLCPHGHWANGRMHDAGEKAAKQQVESGAETWPETSRFFLQAKCAQLARMGCVVFHFDMLGYADSKAIPHAQGFADPEALLWQQSAMGLQTWNCLRSLDFVCGLPDVDTTRIGVTGASGGGTQTFILAALDDRVTAAFPAVMVSTGMQGGCVCENAPYLRVGTGNVELAGLFAPKPLGMTGAKDWTIEIETKGLPELKALYRLYNADDRVMARCFPQFGHNYNQVSREVMYNWFNQHLKLGLPGAVKERPFEPIAPKDLSVFDEQHPRPKDETNAEGVRKYLTEQARAAIQGDEPQTAKALASMRQMVGTSLRVMVNDSLPSGDDVEVKEAGDRQEFDGCLARKLILGRKGQGEQIPAYGIRGAEHDGTVVVWVHPAGKASLFTDGKLTPAARALLDRKAAIVAIDVCGTGELAIDKPGVDAKYAGYTFGYNRPLLAERIHDILTTVAFANNHPQAQRVHLIGWDAAGPWVILARALAGDTVARTAADMNGFRFENVRANDDPMMLPGALKYGGMPAFASLCAPSELLLHNQRGTGTGHWTQAAYKTAGAEPKLHHEPERLPGEKVVDWLLTGRAN